MNNNKPAIPGRGLAVGSLVCGLIALILEVAFFWLFIVVPIIGLVLGIIAIILASMAAHRGFIGGIRSGGLVLGILGIIFGVLMFIGDLTCMAACLIV